MAFLRGYRRDLRSAIRHYRQAIAFSIEPEMLSQIADFICWVIEREPEKYHLLYCFGFFNWKARGDKIHAKKNFNDFLNAGQKDEFDKERELACQWLKEIENE